MTPSSEALNALTAHLEPLVEGLAVICTHPPTSQWGSVRLELQPHKKSAARIFIWEEFDNLQIAIGNRTQEELEGDSVDELVSKVQKLVTSVVSQGYTERSAFGIPLKGRAGQLSPSALTAQKFWDPY